jgi:uncharacterized phage protein gp47/JayE
MIQMLTPPPNIDERTAETMVGESRTLAPFYTPEWNTQETQGAGFALLQNFVQLLFDIVQHLNLTPAKNFVEFLSRLGTRLQSARSARVPVTFLLAPGTPQNLLIPARTQAAAEATEVRPAVVFETEQNLLATIATLQAVYSVRPPDDTIYEHLSELKNSKSSQLFAGKNLQEHSIYLAHSELFALKTQAEIHVQFVIAASGLTRADFTSALSWEWWNKDHWVPSSVPAFKEALSDFPAVTTLNSQISPTATEISVTTNVESDANFPNIGLLLIENEIVQYTGKCASKFTGITRGFGLSNQITGASAALQHNQGEQVRAIDSSFVVHATVGIAQNGRQIVTISLKKTFDAEFGKSKVSDIENFWLRCRTLKGSAVKDSPLRNLAIATIQLSTTTGDEAIAPDQLFYNDVPLDIPHLTSPSVSIHPFGTQPRVFDTFYIASADAFAKKDSTVTLEINVFIDGPLLSPPLTVDPLFTWEYWNGTGWVRLPVADDVLNLFRNIGTFTVVFHCPHDIAAVSVNGQENFWIRVRIVSGSFGTFILQDNKKVEPSFRFPVVNSLAISYTVAGKACDRCITYNDLNYQDQTQNAQTAGTLFQPFQPPEEDRASLYLGFDKPLVSGPIGIFFSLVKQEYLEETKPHLQWQYWNGSAWFLLDVLDDTDNLTRGGLLQLVGPADFAAREKFGAQRFWIRAVDMENRFQSPPLGSSLAFSSIASLSRLPRFSGLLDLALSRISAIGHPPQATSSPTTRLEKPCPELLELFHPKFSVPAALSASPSAPILQGIFPNTTWAVQAETVRDEILGSSDGQPDQTYTLLRRPLVSEEIWVNEMSVLSDEERRKLSAQDPQQIQEVRDENGALTQIWIRWRSVEDFLDSLPTSRDYLVDQVLGTVQFGDGTDGMIPSIGVDNIKATYQFGGGTQGNVEAGVVTSLKTSVAGVDSVTNPEPAGGGADTELLDKALERGPQRIKHRNRAMAREDFEWLARQASTNLAKVKCLPTTNQNGEFETGWVAVIIVPQSQEAQPLPSAELIRQVKGYLSDRCPNVVSVAGKLIVTGPSYVEVSVTAQVFTTSIDLISQVQSDSLKHLKKFLHPLIGGPEGEGWELGRLVCLSDIIAMLEAVPNVDHVNNVTMQLRDTVTQTTRTITDDVLLSATLPPYALIFSGEHNVVVKFQA